MYISLNGKIIKSNMAKVSPLSEAFLYGYGLFETIKVIDGKVYFFREHMKRIKEGSKVLNLEFLYDEDVIYECCLELIEKNELSNGAIRLSYSKNKDKYILLINTRENSYTEESYKNGFKLCFADIKRNPHSPIVYLKSNNYLESILERQRAKDKGFDEAIFFNIYDNVCEGTISNIFFVKNKRIFTPDAKCGILSGILRAKTIEIIRSLGLELNIGEYTRNHIITSDEIFITNSLMDIMPVNSLEDRKFDIEKNYVTRILMKEIKKTYNG